MERIKLGTRKVSIEFPGVKALTDVDFEVTTGEIHALVGANGAGKSTLMKVLAGANPDYTGEVYLNGDTVELRSTLAAKKLGIQIVYQDGAANGQFFVVRPVPKTGDDANLILWIGCALAGLTIISLAAYTGQRKKAQKSRKR